MSAKAGGSLATLLMSVPLAAIPLMAIFGIPQFTPGAAGPRDDDRIIREPEFRGDPAAYRRRAADVLSQRDDKEQRRHAEPIHDAFSHDPFHSPAPGARDRRLADAAPGPQAAGAQRGGSAAPSSDPSAPSPSAGTNWRDASRQLQELGITQYHLERGHQQDTFLFVCMFSPGDNPQVTQRFEAEAQDPLAAVQDVLRQVDEWLRRRFARQTRTTAERSGVP